MSEQAPASFPPLRPPRLDEFIHFIESSPPNAILIWPASFAQPLIAWLKHLETSLACPNRGVDAE